MSVNAVEIMINRVNDNIIDNEVNRCRSVTGCVCGKITCKG